MEPAPIHEGAIYNRRRDIHDRFGGQRQGGISTSAKARSIFIFTGTCNESHGYSDGSASDGYGGSWIIRDEAGRRVGEVTEGYGDRLTVRDASGGVLYQIDEGWGGKLIIRDTSGRRLGTAEPW